MAPAGAGKTALVSDWIRQTGRRAIWLDLDDSDRDAQQLVTALAAAIDQVVPGCAETTMGGARAHARARESAVHGLVDALEDAPSSNPWFWSSTTSTFSRTRVGRQPRVLASFVEHKPEWLDLVLMSRRLPEARRRPARAGGELADVTFDALRFSDTEAMEMLTGLCPEPPPEELPDVA